MIDTIETIADSIIEKNVYMKPEITYILIADNEYIGEYYLPIDEEVISDIEADMINELQEEGIFTDIELKPI